MLDGRNNRFFFPWEQMFFLMQIIFIVLPFNMAAVQNLYCALLGLHCENNASSSSTLLGDRNLQDSSSPNPCGLRNQEECRRQCMQIRRFLVFDETLALVLEILPCVKQYFRTFQEIRRCKRGVNSEQENLLTQHIWSWNTN